MDERMQQAVDEIGKLANRNDLRSIKAIAKRFDEAVAAISTDDKEAREKARAAARGISKEAFELEKKYIPQIPDNDSTARELGCESMIMTVGSQKEPIILSILCMKPKKVILLHTDGSRPTAQEVENDTHVRNMKMEITPLFVTEYDASKNYQIIKDEALPRAAGVTVIDPTAGRKVMVASLALIAFYHRYPMVYIHSVEHEGIIFPFTERLRFIENPFEFFGDAELSLVEDQFNCHLYEAAFRTCEQIAARVRDPATHSKVTALRDLISVYRDWDAFTHSSVPEEKRPVPPLSQKLEELLLDFCRLGFQKCLPQNVDANINFLKRLDETWRDKRNISDELRLVDVFASALRRGSKEQKKYDDAVGRLYRCLELCSTIKLVELGLKDTAKPDYESFTSNIGMTTKQLRDTYSKRKHRKLPSMRLGLEDQMTVLNIAGENIARIYESLKRSKRGSDSLMEIRNRSILAHGTNPVTEEHWFLFRDKVQVIIENTIGKERFQELLSMAMHGQIKTI